MSTISIYHRAGSCYRLPVAFGRLLSIHRRNDAVALIGRPETMTKVSEYVKVAEAAEILGVSQNTVRAWAENGKLPVHRNPANGYRLFRRSDLDAFLEQVGKQSPPRKR